MNTRRSIDWERSKCGLYLLPHFYSSRGTMMRLRFYHNVNCWFKSPRNACLEAARWLALLCKHLRWVLCGAVITEISRNLGQECGCDRAIYGSKFPIPLTQDHDSLCQGKGCRKEKGNKGTKRKSKPSLFPPISPGVFIFFKPGEFQRLFMCYLLLLSYFPSSQPLAHT